ncbi:MAG TPA: ankyrin repeat domain-containing protein [Vicinamibacterales bacterium]|nr:ankyrin repeat domain-containing protein [Vicinamibacterales bacterium]
MSKTRLIEAVKTLDLEETKRILEAKPELLKVWNDQGRNLLHLACSVDCEAAGRPPSAAVKMVAFLLDKGFDIEEDGGAGPDLCKPIWFATAKGRNKPVVKLLLDRGATPTGLYAAGWWEDIDILNMLIDAGADKEVVVGVTPFLACWGWKKFKAAKALALKGADVNVQDARGRTALHVGVEKEYDPALLKWLVKHGASPDIADRDGVTARQRASRKRNQKFREALQ